jgi:hypothetical protein
MATPIVAGLAALARQYFTDGYYPTGRPVPTDAFDPSAALVKAALVNSARSMQNVEPPISRVQGFGRVTLADTLHLPQSDRDLFVVDEPASFPTGDTGLVSFDVEVVSSELPLKVTLVWTDAPSNPLAVTNLVNDLDLEVSGPSGSYLGNVLTDGFSVEGGAADRLNVEEQVNIQDPAPGTWTLSVRAAAIPQGPQGFALVATGDFPTPPALRYASWRILSTSDGDLTAEPGETIRLALSLRNPADALATEVSARLSSTAPEVHVSDDQASWPDIAGSSQAESLPDHYEVVLGEELACATSIPFELEMLTAGESFSDAFSLPVGELVLIDSESFDSVPPDDLPAGWAWSSSRPAMARAGADPSIEDTATSPGPVSAPNALYIGKTGDQFSRVETQVTRAWDLSGLDGQPLYLSLSYWGYDLEFMDDLAVHISDDGGASFAWELFKTPAMGFDSATDAGNQWSQLTVDIGSLPDIVIGPDVVLRLRATMNETEIGDAAYVDDVSLTAPFCDGPGCSEATADASLTDTQPMCPAAPVLLDGSLSAPEAGCSAALDYEWWDGDELVAQGVSPTVWPLGTTLYELRVRCSVSPHCEDRDAVTIPVLPGSAPAIDGNSLRGVKLAGSARLSWSSTGPDRYNVHETSEPAALPLLYTTAPLNPSPLTAPLFEAPAPGPGLTLYGAYGASDCDDRSLPDP